MSLFSNGGMSPADIAAVTGNNNDGWGGNNGWWIIILLLAMNGGWGNGMGGNNGAITWPYFFDNSNNATQRGFDTAAITGQLTAILSAITGGLSSAEVANCNRAFDSMQTAYNNQIASMNQSFANAQAIDSRLDNIVLQQQNCCCENRQQVADLKYTVAQEAAAIRSNTDAKVQMILDTMCQNKIDDLNRELNAATRRAELAEQTQTIENYIRPQINPSFSVPNPYAYYPGWNTNGCCGQIG